MAMTAAMPAAMATSAASQADPDNDTGECRLLGPFALLVQLALGALALSSLVYKRWRERPQRPLKIWFFDVSKQVFGSVLVHAANVFMSMLTSGRFTIKADPAILGQAARHASMALLRRDDDATPNPCSFYLLNLAIDTTVGIPILILLLRLTTLLVSYTPLGSPLESIQSGYYGDPPNVCWWLKQSVIYFFGLFGMKLCVLIIFLVFPWIESVGNWALGWTEGNERLQIVFVMMLFPLLMNALQYYIIDSFIKDRATSHVPADQLAVPSPDIAYDELLPADGDADADEGDDGGRRPGKAGPEEVGLLVRAGRTGTAWGGEYDPAVDDDSQTVASSGSNGALPPGRGRLAHKDIDSSRDS